MTAQPLCSVAAEAALIPGASWICKSDAVAKSVAEVLGVPSVGDHVARCRVDVFARACPGASASRPACCAAGHQVIDVALPLRGLPSTNVLVMSE